MSNSKHGAVGWDEPVSDAMGKGKDDFLRLKPGNNVLRLLSLPHLYNQHRYEPEGGKKYGYRINCSRSETEKSCPLCEQGNKAKKRWFVSVLEKNTGAVKTLDIGPSVFKSVQTLAKSEWGSPDKYDVNIIVDPQGGMSGYYSVVPMPPTPLSAEDVAKQEEVNGSNDLEGRTTPPTPERVQTRLDKIAEEISSGGTGQPMSKTGSASKPTVDETENDEDDFFKNYNKQKAG